MKALGTVIWWLAFVVSAAIFAMGVWFATKLSGTMAVALIIGASLKAALILAMGYFVRYLWDRQSK